MTDDRRTRAKEFLDKRDFREAGALYHQLADETNEPWYASRYLHCLRKAGHSRAAVTVGRRTLERHPQDVWVRRELVWAMYEARVKTCGESKDLPGLVQAAEEVLALEPEPLPLKLAVNAVIRLAKLRGKWDLVCRWCDFLDPDSLDDQPREIDGRSGKSERQSWHFARVKALLELERWDEALASAVHAAGRYPREVNFRRWAALALAGQGNITEAIRRLKDIILKDRSEWFLLQDLCQLHLQNGELDAALRNGCRAALDCPDDTVKVSLYGLLGTIGLRLSRDEFAFRHAALARSIREREGWSIPSDLRSVEGDLRSRFAEGRLTLPVVPAAVREQAAACVSLWRAAAYAGLPRQSGVLDSPLGDRPFGWIRGEEGERIFVLRDHLPQAARTVGAAVEFAREPSFDRKRQQLTVRAVDVVYLGQEATARHKDHASVQRGSGNPTT
jgi:tetratricopeptide (TPR) repeat protein